MMKLCRHHVAGALAAVIVFAAFHLAPPAVAYLLATRSAHAAGPLEQVLNETGPTILYDEDGVKGIRVLAPRHFGIGSHVCVIAIAKGRMAKTASIHCSD